MEFPIPQLIDRTGQDVEFEETGNLYVHRQPDQPYIPFFSKPLDVGLDLPVKININKAKLTESNETQDRLRQVMLYPELKQYIHPDGDEEEPLPYLDVPAMGWAEIPAAISVKIPDDAWGLILPRSRTNWRLHQIVVPSVIDPGYVGLLGTLAYNPNNVPVRVREYDCSTKQGDKISQMILIPRYPIKNVVLVDNLPETARGKTGFGSSSGESSILRVSI